MICLRCGYCCHVSLVVIVDDPAKGIAKNNLIAVNLLEEGACKHLVGHIPGQFSCAIHNKTWYKKTPCFKHGQIEAHPDCECRMGRYVLDNNIDTSHWHRKELIK